MTDNENNETGGDFLEDANSIAKNWSGVEATPEFMVNEFAMYGHAKRAAYLDNLDRQMKTPNDSDLRRLSDLITLKGELSALHHRLRESGR
jgi:hypothetical protein